MTTIHRLAAAVAALLLAMLPAAALAAADTPPTMLLLVKNVTRSDSNTGSTSTTGYSGDEVRYLLYIKNNTGAPAAYTTQLQLPSGSTVLQWRRLDTASYSWEEQPLSTAADILQVQLPTDGRAIYTWRTQLPELPAINQILTTVATATDATGTVHRASSRVLVPQAPVATQETFRQLSTNDAQLLAEEFAYIEEVFRQATATDTTPMPTAEPHTEREYNGGAVVAAAALAAVVCCTAIVLRRRGR